MNKLIKKFSLGAFVFLYLIHVQTHAQINTPAGASVPFGSNNSYAYGIMPTNLPTSGTYGKASDIADKYNAWKAAYIENCGTNQARVRFDNQSETVSEGIAYGMLLAAYAADKDLFNRLWAYYKQHRNTRGVMHWKISGCNSVIGQNGATDAELDAAMALIVANHQWPNTTTPHNYKTDAVALINAVKNYEINATDYTFENGDAWKPACRNPSYQAPGYARVFKLFMAENGQADNAFWDNVVQRTENLLINNAHVSSGLSTNWCTPAGPPSSSCSGSGTAPDKFGYDACRAPWRQATDYIWYGPTTIQTITNRQAAYWIGRGGAGSVQGGDGLNHDGSGSGNHNAAFVGPIGAMSLSLSNTTANQAFCNALYTTNRNDALAGGYFTKILQMIGLFVQTGNFWNPYAVASSSTIAVTLTAPTSTSAAEGDAITVSATPTVTSGAVSKVDFYAGAVLIGTDNSSPYSINWTANVSGSVSITAVATNTNGDVATSTAFVISVYKSVVRTATAPMIDGTEGAVWSASTSATLGNTIDGTITNSADLSAYYKALWDDSYFYVLVNVTDNTKVNNGGTDYYNDDAVEVYFDIGNNKPSVYGANDFQYTFRWNDNTIYEKNNKTTGVTFGRIDNATGYVMTMRFPWSTLTGTPAINQLVGFDVHVNDDDDSGARDGKMSWAATVDQAWTNPSYMGTVILKGLSCTPPAAAGSITGNTTTCAGSTGVIYSIAAVSNATGYTWTLPAGATITSGTNTNSITVTFGSAGGNITVTPTNTCGSGTSSSSTVTVSAAVTPSVTAVATATTICAGTSVTFTAAPTNGGTPTYQWRRNGTGISGATAATYSTSSISNGDVFDVVMTSTANCRSANTATSAQVSITVTSSVTPSVTAVATATTICAGTSVTFTAAPTNGGTPTYQWRRNGTGISGATAATYSTSSISSGDVFDVVMTSTANCRSANTATSAQVTITVTSSVTPSVAVNASATTICAGTSVMFTAAPTNGGTPTYQWRRNGTGISGATAATYSTSSISNGDVFDVVMTSTANCRSANTATSAQVTITVTPSVTPAVSVSSTATTICAGTSVTFTATPTNGGTPTYQWRRNGGNISGATAATYSTSSISNGDVFTVVMTSTATCRSANTATSSPITMIVNANVVPAVAINSTATAICAGTSVTFTATPVNGGTPAYQWRRNGGNISGATAATYSTSSISNGDVFTVVMTSTATCRSANTATSSPITMIVNASVTPTITINVNATTICSGTTVTFTSSHTNGGTPSFQWRRNSGNIDGATASTYTTSSISNNDQFTVVMTSTADCRTTDVAASAPVTMTLSSALTASVSIAVSPSSNTYNGQTITFTASAVNGGPSPAYQWRNGNVEIPGATNATFSSSTLSTGSSINVMMTSNASCVSPSSATVTSSNITVTVNPYPTFDTSITGPTNVDANQANVTYSVANQTGMSYVWSVPPGAAIISGQNTNSIVVNFGLSSGTVTVTETNPAGQTSVISITINVGPATPITLPTEVAVSVYPVPCSEAVTIDMNMSEHASVSYMMVDATGNVVRRGIIEYAGTAVQLETDVAAGVYQLLLQWNNKSAMNRIIKY